VFWSLTQQRNAKGAMSKKGVSAKAEEVKDPAKQQQTTKRVIRMFAPYVM
jgi:hypothetical protein